MHSNKDWFKDRGYPHFSNKTPIRVRRRIEEYISDEKKIAKHSFSPLIFKEIKQRRYKLSSFNGVERRSHKKLKNGKVISNLKIREILYATHIDSHVYSYYTQKIISPKYELKLKSDNTLDNAITAYRQIKTEDGLKNKNNINFAKDAFDEVKRRQNCVVLAFDIENFFPSLNHRQLKLVWAKILGLKSLPKAHYNIFKASTNFSYVKLNDLKKNIRGFDEKELSKHRKEGKNTFFDNIKSLIDSEIIIHKNQKKNQNGSLMGIPQGLPISALLANMYMLPFDESIVNLLVKKFNVFYRRYSDDIIMICEENQVEFVEQFVINEINKIELIISKEKTEKTLFKVHGGRLQCFRILNDSLKMNIPLNYLGFEFYGYQTLIKSKNLSAFYREMKMSINRKYKRVEKIKEKHLLDSPPIFKRKIYRLYSFKGVKSRKLPTKRSEFRNGILKSHSVSRKFRGNYLKYAYKASEELEAPEIKKQLRNHWKILQTTMSKYDFSNVKSNQNE
tara:strand:- start:402 stop:1916 length:1515 start_codon:yes stop_codon:yes gene_type:complete